MDAAKAPIETIGAARYVVGIEADSDISQVFGRSNLVVTVRESTSV